jgi:HEAT repeat protein
LSRLIESLDSPHPAVRKAARKGLSEFSFERFLGTFDLLEDDARRTTGDLVKKVDPQVVPQLRQELHSKVRTRRLRGLTVARCLDVAREVENSILELLADDDHMVRAEAAAALGRCRTLEAHSALREALGDRSPMVQEAAQKALDELDVPAVDEAPVFRDSDLQELPQ